MENTKIAVVTVAVGALLVGLVAGYHLGQRSQIIEVEIPKTLEYRLASTDTACSNEFLGLVFHEIGKNIPAQWNNEVVRNDGAQPNGRYGFGFIKKVTEERSTATTLTIDPALWFKTNWESSVPMPNYADMAAKENGHTRGSSNGFYVRDENHATRDHIISPSAQIFIVTTYSGEEPDPDLCGYEMKSLDTGAYLFRIENQLKQSPGSVLPIYFDLDSEGTIIRVVEQYVP